MAINEKVIQITGILDTDTSKTNYIFLTSEGRIFQSHNLVEWELMPLPDFTKNIYKKEVTKLHG